MKSSDLFAFLFLCVLCLILPINVLTKDDNCPPCDDPNFKFETDFSSTDCGNDEYYYEKHTCDCFPACVKKKGYNEECDVTKNECAPGLMCDDNEIKCKLDISSCFHYKFITNANGFLNEVKWKNWPKCLPDGSYASLQCKEDRCYCYDRKGNRIFGNAFKKDSENMTCACSRRYSELLESGRTDVSLHCDSIGNYEPLQCDSGLCWCTDPKSGLPTASVVPDGLMEKLPCYDKSTTGIQYLRRCESQAMAQAKIIKEFATHGSIVNSMIKVNCDPDGSYGNIQVENNQALCRWRDNSNIGSYFAASKDKKNMNCNCARDTKLFQVIGVSRAVRCESNGNYELLVDFDGKPYCVDSDGHALNEPQDEDVKLNCENWFYQLIQ